MKPSSFGNSQKRPNLLLVHTDQQRWDSLGALSSWADTPCLDQLTKGGTLFTHAITNSPVCQPARTSLITGLLPHELGIWNNGSYGIHFDTPTWVQSIRSAGYETAVFGKTHWFPCGGDLIAAEPLLHSAGFNVVNEVPGPRALQRARTHLTERWDAKGLWNDFRMDYESRFQEKEHLVRPTPLPTGEYYDSYVGDCALEWIQKQNSDNPWFCYVSFPGPHEPYDAPEEYAQRINPSGMPPPREAPKVLASEKPQGKLDSLPHEDHYHGAVNLEPGEAQRIRADQVASVRLIDDKIAAIVEELKNTDQWENTIVVFASDHGELGGDAGLIFKCCFLDSALRVPLLISTPASRENQINQRIHAPVEWRDIGPTLVDFAGGQMNHPQGARSLVSLLEDSNSDFREFAVSEIDEEICLFSRQWKVALNQQGECYLLINRLDDPEETRNLAALRDYQEIENHLTSIAQNILKTNSGGAAHLLEDPWRSVSTG